MTDNQQQSAATNDVDKTRYADDKARQLIDSKTLQIFHAPQNSDLKAVKNNASRTVYHGWIGGQEIYLKHYHRKSWIYRVQQCMGISDSMREFRFAMHLAKNGVATAQVLAAHCSGGIEWLATQAVAPAQRCDEWNIKQLSAGPNGRKLIRRAAAEIGTMIGKMHACGMIHHDLHCGNILMQGNGDDCHPVLTDLHRANLRCRLSRASRAANLAQLFHDRLDFTTRTDRLRFLKHYMLSSNAEGTLRGWQLLVEDFAQRHSRRQYSQRDRRVSGNNKYFHQLSFKDGWKARVVLASKRKMGGSIAADIEFTPQQWREILSNPADLFIGDGVKIVKDSPSSLVVRRKLKIGQNEIDVYIKRARCKNKLKSLFNCFRKSRAIRAFQLGHEILTRRIATALPLAAIERRTGPFLADSIIITETVEGNWLHDFMEKWLGETNDAGVPLDNTQRHTLAQEVLWQLGRLLQRLHDSNYSHRDLKATNLLVRWQPGWSWPELVLVDLDGLKPAAIITMRSRLQGLMRLNVSLLKCPAVNRAGRLRMLMGYLRRPGCGSINFKPYWRLLEDWSRQKLDQQIRSRQLRQREIRRPAG